MSNTPTPEEWLKGLLKRATGIIQALQAERDDLHKQMMSQAENANRYYELADKLQAENTAQAERIVVLGRALKNCKDSAIIALGRKDEQIAELREWKRSVQAVYGIEDNG